MSKTLLEHDLQKPCGTRVASKKREGVRRIASESDCREHVPSGTVGLATTSADARRGQTDWASTCRSRTLRGYNLAEVLIHTILTDERATLLRGEAELSEQAQLQEDA